MKELKIAGIALAAILMVLNTTSCNKEGNGGNINNEKKIVKMSETWDNGTPHTFKLQYDENGRLNKVTEVDKNGGIVANMDSFIWGDDIINCTDGEGYTITLENGLMQYSDAWGGATFTYNKSNRMTKMEMPQAGGITNATWDGDKLTLVTGDYDVYHAITYQDSCKKGYCPITGLLINDGTPFYFLFIAHPELIGIRTNKLPATISLDNENSDISTYSYEFDSDGYVTKVTELNSDYTLTYDLTWE